MDAATKRNLAEVERRHEQRVKSMVWRITKKRGIRGRRPCIRDTGIHIAIILYMLAQGATAKSIVNYYEGAITLEDVYAAILYAAEIVNTIPGGKTFGWVHSK